MNATRPSTSRAGVVIPSNRLDRLGAAGSLICAAHCALWPLLLALIPALGLSFLASPLFERGFVIFAGVLATLSLLPGFRRHRSPLALLILLPGLVGVGIGAFGSTEHSDWSHALLMSLGGVLIAAAHLVNLSLLRRRPVPPVRTGV
ncbi:MAG: MerC domain-containing protein [Lysobacteraceae bacterium]